MKKTVAVLGLGQYGEYFARDMYEFGADVLIVDRNEKKLKDMAMCATSAIQADLSIEEEVISLGLRNMDLVVVAMAGNLAASIMSVAVAKEQNVPVIIAKSSSDRMSAILERLGADYVIVPERIGAIQSSMIYASDNFLDYFKIDDNLCMVEMKPLNRWVGKTIVDLDLRSKHGLNVVAIKSGQTWEILKPMNHIKADDTLLIALKREDLPGLKP